MASITAESNGNSEHTEALYRAHGAAVAALCRSLLRDRGEAEDATQQVFLSAHRALLNGTVPREPLAWLLTVARNECYARFRERAATPVPAGEAAGGATVDASVHVLRAGELATMWDEVGRMPQAQRDAFLLREIRGLSYGQLATELSLSAASVRSLLLRARTRLRHRLADVAAGLGGAQWVQALLRIAGGGDGPSAVPAAAKATAVGLGALSLVGGGNVQRTVHHAPAPRAGPRVYHRAGAHCAVQRAWRRWLPRPRRARTGATSTPAGAMTGTAGRDRMEGTTTPSSRRSAVPRRAGTTGAQAPRRPGAKAAAAVPATRRRLLLRRRHPPRAARTAVPARSRPRPPVRVAPVLTARTARTAPAVTTAAAAATEKPGATFSRRTSLPR